MPIQPWRTFLLSGIVPAGEQDRTSIGWPLQEPHRADPRRAKHTQANRLLGRAPQVRVAGGEIQIHAGGDREAVYRSATLALDTTLTGGLAGGDVLTIARTMTEDIGVSLVRDGLLVWAVGAVAAVPLGGTLRARLGPAMAQGEITAQRWPTQDTWIEFSWGPDHRTLRDGETASIGGYAMTVRHAATPPASGQARRENAAISRADVDLHDATLRAAERLDRPSAGLTLHTW